MTSFDCLYLAKAITMALSLGLNLNYSGRKITLDLEGINRAEKLGFDSVWTAESWGSDAVSPLAWIRG